MALQVPKDDKAETVELLAVSVSSFRPFPPESTGASATGAEQAAASRSWWTLHF